MLQNTPLCELLAASEQLRDCPSAGEEGLMAAVEVQESMLWASIEGRVRSTGSASQQVLRCLATQPILDTKMSDCNITIHSYDNEP